MKEIKGSKNRLIYQVRQELLDELEKEIENEKCEEIDDTCAIANHTISRILKIIESKK